MMTTLSHEPRFELATAETWPTPWPMYRALRDHDPVHHVVPPKHPEDDYYVLSRHADVWSAARDHETFSSAQGLTVNYGDLEMIGLKDNPPFVMQDPPVHTEFRKLVSRGFTPRQVEAVEPKVREFVVERIEQLRANGGGDIVTELFKPLPSMVVAHYLGVPEKDWIQFDGWTQAIVAANTAEGGVSRRAGDRRRRGRIDDGLLHRADRVAPPGTRGRHHLPPGRGWGRRRRRHRRHAVDSGVHVHDGHRRQRHRHRHAGRLDAAAAPAARPAKVVGGQPRTDPGRRGGIATDDHAGAGPGAHRHQRRDDR